MPTTIRAAIAQHRMLAADYRRLARAAVTIDTARYWQLQSNAHERAADALRVHPPHSHAF